MDPTEPEVEDKFYEFKAFRVPKYQIKFDRAERISDIEGYMWYSPAALYAWGRFTDVNLAEIVSREDIKVFWYKFDKPIFSNFGKDWNHTLWAAALDDWPKIVDGVLETVQFDIPNKTLYQYALQEVEVLDPLAVDVQRVVLSATPSVTVSSFAVLSNQAQYAFDPNRQRVRGEAPGMDTRKPLESHVKAARVLFSGDSLTQDDVFSRYKRVMQRFEDAAYATESQNKHAEERRKRGSK